MEDARGAAPAFRWNRAGWFGGQLGGTLWLLLAGVLIAPRDGVSAAVALACFALPNLLGWQLWRRRARWRAHPALQLLIAVMAAAATVALVTLNARGRALPGAAEGVPYWVLLVYPALSLQVLLRERATRARHG